MLRIVLPIAVAIAGSLEAPNIKNTTKSTSSRSARPGINNPSVLEADFKIEQARLFGEGALNHKLKNVG